MYHVHVPLYDTANAISVAYQVGNEDMVEMAVDEWLKKVDLNSDGYVTTNEFLGALQD